MIWDARAEHAKENGNIRPKRRGSMIQLLNLGSVSTHRACMLPCAAYIENVLRASDGPEVYVLAVVVAPGEDLILKER